MEPLPGEPVDPHLVWLWKRIEVTRMFPAYKLHELDRVPARDLLIALQLIQGVKDLTTPNGS